MTNEEKQLLIKDLCARLPHGVKVWRQGGTYVISCIDIEKQRVYLKVDFEATRGWWFDIEEVKLYLRPMSSMTEEEEREVRILWNEDFADKISWYHCYPKTTDFYNKHHFDYRGLISMGLALEAPPEMYDKEESEKGDEVPIPKTVDEAVKTLAKIVSKEDREYLLKNGAISVHHSLGRWIRNEWGLWADSELKNELKKKGFEHPDDMSNYIIVEFIKYWNNKI